jgi:hypothetical protein
VTPKVTADTPEPPVVVNETGVPATPVKVVLLIVSPVCEASVKVNVTGVEVVALKRWVAALEAVTTQVSAPLAMSAPLVITQPEPVTEKETFDGTDPPEEVRGIAVPATPVNVWFETESTFCVAAVKTTATSEDEAAA